MATHTQKTPLIITLQRKHFFKQEMLFSVKPKANIVDNGKTILEKVSMKRNLEYLKWNLWKTTKTC